MNKHMENMEFLFNSDSSVSFVSQNETLLNF